MALRIEIIEKIHRNRKLVAYKIRTEQGEESCIAKDAVKEAIRNGKVEVTNMTVTSDGRILGSAKPSIKKDSNKEIEYKIVEVYTHNDKIVGALVDESDAVKANIISNHDINGLGSGYTFETADIAIDRIANNIYSNIKLHDNEVKSSISRVEFSTVLKNMINLLVLNDVAIETIEITAKFSEDTQECRVYNPLNKEMNETIRRVAILLITSSLYDSDFDVKAVNDESISVRCDSERARQDIMSIAINAFK